MAGLGSIYTGIGLAQGLGSIPESYTMGRKAAEESAMNAIRRQAEMEALKNTRVSRERTIRQMEDEQKLRDTLSRLGEMGKEYQTVLEGTEREVEEPTLKSIDQQAKESLGATDKSVLGAMGNVDLSGKPINLGAMGSPLGGTPYTTTTKKVRETDWDKVSSLRNQMGMAFQEASLYDPRYATVAQKALSDMDERILKRTFGAGLTGDTKTIASGLKVLTGQEFNVEKDGDSFLIKAVGDESPVRIRLDELPLLSDPINFVKYAQKYNETQQKSKVAKERLAFEKEKLTTLKLYPFVVQLDNGEISGFPDKKSADAYAEKMGAVSLSNPEYDLKQAQIKLAQSKAKEGSGSSTLFRPKPK